MVGSRSSNTFQLVLEIRQGCGSAKSVAARRLYERHGFQVWGIEPDGIRAEGESARIDYMGLRLK